MSIVVIGVDPGISGAFCVLEGDYNGNVLHISVRKNPFVYYKKQYGKAVVDNKVLAPPVQLILIEGSQIRVMTNSRKTVAGIWWYAGILDTFFRINLPDRRIEYVDPKQWHGYVFSQEVLDKYNLLLPDKRNGDVYNQWKQLSVDYTSEKYGSEILIPKGGKKENDGFADAICIAEFAFAMELGKVELKRTWAKEK